jgi:hypothetical protein
MPFTINGQVFGQLELCVVDTGIFPVLPFSDKGTKRTMGKGYDILISPEYYKVLPFFSRNGERGISINQ